MPLVDRFLRQRRDGRKLIEECFISDYEGGAFVNNSVRQLKFTQNTMCGWKRKAVCIVQVRGKK